MHDECMFLFRVCMLYYALTTLAMQATALMSSALTFAPASRTSPTLLRSASAERSAAVLVLSSTSVRRVVRWVRLRSAYIRIYLPCPPC